MKYLASIFGVVLLAMLTACQTPVQPADAKLPRFLDKGVIRLDAASININEEYQSPAKAPFVEHTFNYSPSDVLKSWVNDRIRTVGKSRRVEVTIMDASVKETSLPKTPGLKGLFTNDQAARYDGTMDVEVRIYDENKAIAVAEAKANGRVSRTLAENASLIERDAFFDKMSLDLVNETTSELEKNLRQYFGPFIR